MALTAPNQNSERYHQNNLFEFNGVAGLHLDTNNRWVVFSQMIPWDKLEEAYQKYLEKAETKPPTILGSMATTASRVMNKIANVFMQGQFSLADNLKEMEDLGLDTLKLCGIDSATMKAQIECSSKQRSGNGGAGGRKPYPLRIMLGCCMIQDILGVSDRATSNMIAEGPYLQYFLGYEEFSGSNTVHYSQLYHFREKLNFDVMQELNEIINRERMESNWYERFGISGHVTLDQLVEAMKKPLDGTPDQAPESKCKFDEHDEAEETIRTGSTISETAVNDDVPETQKDDDGIDADKPKSAPSESANKGSLILDATCGPVNMRYPQDFILLNEARTRLDEIIDRLYHEYEYDGEEKRPRTYRRTLQSMVQDLSKTKRKSEEKVRPVVNKLLNSLVRNLNSIDTLLKKDSERELLPEEARDILTIRMIYKQQKEMYDNKTHRCVDRIVSIEMPFLRPIVRGKTTADTEFGPKFDVSIDDNGFARIETFSYDSFNESRDLKNAVESYYVRHGYYPEQVLVDQIYRTTDNLKYCSSKGIKVSGPKLGRKPSDPDKLAELEAQEKAAQKERIEVERRFARMKHSFGIECIMERTAGTIGHAVGMAVFLDNVLPVGF